ncbi:hypothetical protein [Celerinatantimonas sp. YJH-8]|uniref:hypothetical protein n=1 Tax=Celerinatantimonas sp. YJH-8 TaxID=3228714 RepID=UPI0038C1C695
MANTQKATKAAADDSGESIWGKVADSFTNIANTAANAYATSAGLKNNPNAGNSANPASYPTNTAAQQPNGTPIISSNATTTYLMWGAIALFVIVILVVLVKVL